MFYSILFPSHDLHEQPRRQEAPECFRDLNILPIIDSVLKGYSAYGLESLFYTSLDDSETIRYRQKILRDLENLSFRDALAQRCQTLFWLERTMNDLKKMLSSRLWYENSHLNHGRILETADRYCEEVSGLSSELDRFPPDSEGLSEFAIYLSSYLISEGYRKLEKQISHLKEGLSKIRYCMYIKDSSIRVRPFEGEKNLSARIVSDFEKFRHEPKTVEARKMMGEPYSNHVEAAVLNMVAGYNKEMFSELGCFCSANRDFMDETILRFAREMPFFLAWLSYLRPLKASGLHFHFPAIQTSPQHLYCRDGFDLALATQTEGKVVTNDFSFDHSERILVVTGPNQGGKTTYARMFGQIHWFASLGLSVPGSDSSLLFFDRILTHFGREEKMETLNGKLRDDLVRFRDLLEKATPRSIVIVNEIFASATLSDALVLGRHMLERLVNLGVLGVIVTFLDELSNFNQNTVSLVALVASDDPSQRTFRIIRKPADGLAQAMDLAKKHGLTREQLQMRIRQ